MVDISIGTAGLAAVLGYAVVFFGIVLLMVVIYVMGSIMKKNSSAVAPAVSNKKEINEEVTDLGSINAPAGMDPKKVAAVAAVIAAMEGKI